MPNTKFYDIHCHALTLSHPSFVSYVETVRRRKFELLYSQVSSPTYLAAALFSNAGIKIRNMFSVMENDVGSIFELMEDDLRGFYAQPGDSPAMISGNRLRIGETDYEALVITPLIMDFEDRDMAPSEAYYHKPPSKPVMNQVRDVLQGIRDYRMKRPRGFLEIRPFLGINTRNYSPERLSSLIESSFSSFSRDAGLSSAAFAKMDRYKAELEDGFRFAGVKLYPPLGFDPWPEEGPERDKVELLYAFCAERRIPITTHCDDQGFRVVSLETGLALSSPARWRPVLERFPGLILNFAHFGMQYTMSIGKAAPIEWAEEILRMMSEYPRVYADISFNGTEKDYYPFLLELLGAQEYPIRERARERIMFGTDFPVNLTKIRSYADYYRFFSESGLSAEEKDLFGRLNPERFLFGA